MKALQATLDPAKRYHPHTYELHGDGIAIVYRTVEEVKEMPVLVVSRA